MERIGEKFEAAIYFDGFEGKMKSCVWAERLNERCYRDFRRESEKTAQVFQHKKKTRKFNQVSMNET